MINIGFRVDAGNKVGMGHLMESISLAESLRKRIECNIIFLTTDFLPALDILKQRNYQVEILKEKPEENEIKQTLKIIKKKPIDVLIIDLLDESAKHFQKLKSWVKVLAVILDDDKHRAIPSDIVVNFNIAQDKDFYSKFSTQKTIYCIGPEYMLMPEELHEEWKKEKITPNVCKTIFVNQGGSDPYGLTSKIIKSLELLNLKQRIIVAVGHAMSTKHKRELKHLRSQLKNDYRIEWGATLEQIYEFMSESDLAITAAGNTLYELALFGVPSIVVCQHEKHAIVARKFAERNAVINLGIGTTLETSTVAGAVDKLLRSRKKRLELSINAKKIVDGLGSKRVAEKVLEACQKYL